MRCLYLGIDIHVVAPKGDVINDFYIWIYHMVLIGVD